MFYRRPISVVRRSLWFIAFLTVLFFSSFSKAAEVFPAFVHETWSVKDGLPVNKLTRLIQTSDGYLWMATYDGLVRFDGVRFTVFNMSNSVGLPSNRILDLLEDNDGSLWMLTEQHHLVRFSNGAFENYSQGNSLGGALSFYKDAEGLIWIGAEKGASYYKDGKLVPYAEDLLSLPVAEILHSSDGAIWAATPSSGVLRVSAGNVISFTRDNGLADNRVTSLYEDDSATVWIGSETGVHYYQDGKLNRLPIEETLDRRSGSAIEFFHDSRSDNLWIGKSRAVFRYHKSSGVLKRFEGNDNTGRYPHSFALDSAGNVCFTFGDKLFRNGEVVYQQISEADNIPEVRSMLHDHEGSIWIASGTQGLHRLRPSFFTVYSEPEGVASKNIYPILESRDGAIWLGTWGYGVSRLKDGTIISALGAGLVKSLCEDSNGRLWVGSQYGARAYEFEDGALEQVSGLATVGGIIFAIYENLPGELWFGGRRGLFRMRNDSIIDMSGHDGAPVDPVRVFYKTKNGSLWMGTNGGGLVRFREGRFESFTEKDGLSSDLIRAIYEDEDGFLWIGSEGSGMCRLDRHGQYDLSEIAVTSFRSADGLYDEMIHQILEDNFGRLWMSSNRGIFWIAREQLNSFADGSTKSFFSTSYTEHDGMRDREANGGMQPAGIRASDGRLWWPTQDGAVVVDPSRIQLNITPPPVVIEAVTANKTVHRRVSSVQLKANQRNFEIDYTALSFMAPENVRFKYRLWGFQNEWVEVAGRRTAYYTNIPSGEYRFQVIASNNDGVWNETGASLDLTVAPYFYERSWFLLLMSLAVLSLAWAGHRFRTLRLVAREVELKAIVAARTRELVEEKEVTEREHKRADEQRITADHLREVAEQARAIIERQAEKLKTLDQAKSRFFANVSHEFRTPLTLIIGPLEDLLMRAPGELPSDVDDELRLVLRNGHRLLRLVNQILDIAKIEAGQMSPHIERADLTAFLSHLAPSFSSLAERQRISFQVELTDEPLWMYYDTDLLEKVFTNLLSNAFKFTAENGVVLLRVDAARAAGLEGEIDVIVKDNGPGIPADKLSHIFERFYTSNESSQSWQMGTGIGLSLAKELVDLHSGSITVKSKEGFGSTFTVTLKCGSSHLRPEDIAKSPQETDVVRVIAMDSSADSIEPSLPEVSVTADSDDVTTVLVVDDNAEIRKYIRGHLESKYKVVEAHDGVSGLDATRKWLPDLIISDVMMPQMDGYEFCAELKKDSELDYIPVILLTARATMKEKIDGLELGADDYLTKPFDITELSARVSNLIESRQRLRERFRRDGASVSASKVIVLSQDDTLLEDLRNSIEAEISNEDFTVDRLAEQVSMSRGHLHRRLRDLLKETPTELIQRIRLERAMQLLAGQAGSVSEVAYGVGFKSVSHFSKRFREHVGITPSQYIAQQSSRDS